MREWVQRERRATLLSSLGLYLKTTEERSVVFFFFFFGRGGGCDGRGGEVHQLLISEWIRLPSDCVWTEKRVQDTITRNIYIWGIDRRRQISKKEINRSQNKKAFQEGKWTEHRYFYFLFVWVMYRRREHSY